MTPTPQKVGATPPLSGHRLTKYFGQIRALDDVDLVVGRGEILGLVGDNGAGKSTLMKVLTGIERADSGELRLDGQPIVVNFPHDARRHGINAVSQDLGLVECLDIASNLFMGANPCRGPMIDRRRMDAESADLLARLGITDHSPRTPVGLLPSGHRQLIAVARALRLQSRVVVMDEPTAALGVRERTQIAGLIADARTLERSLILISHDLDLVFDLADRIHVLRLGRTAGVRNRRETDRDEIVGLIAGARHAAVC